MSKRTLILLTALICGGLSPLHASDPKAPAKKGSIKSYTDWATREENLQRLSTQAHAEAQLVREDMEPVLPIPMPDVHVDETELPQIHDLASQGDPRALVQLGHYYMMHPVPDLSNELQAGEYFRKAADTGHPNAIAWYALYHFIVSEGNLLSKWKTLHEAALPAAQAGSILGAYLAGTASQNDAEKALLLEPAARKGFVPAIRAYGELLHRQHRANPNLPFTPDILADARTWLEIASNAGDPQATYILSSLSSLPHSQEYADQLEQGEELAHKAIDQMLSRRWNWYDRVFDDWWLQERYTFGGARIGWILHYFGGIERARAIRGLDATDVRDDCIHLLQKLANEGQADALTGLVILSRKWKFCFRFAPGPSPVKEQEYLSRLQKMADEGDMQALRQLQTSKAIRPDYAPRPPRQ